MNSKENSIAASNLSRKEMLLQYKKQKNAASAVPKKSQVSSKQVNITKPLRQTKSNELLMTSNEVVPKLVPNEAVKRVPMQPINQNKIKEAGLKTVGLKNHIKQALKPKVRSHKNEEKNSFSITELQSKLDEAEQLLKVADIYVVRNYLQQLPNEPNMSDIIYTSLYWLTWIRFEEEVNEIKEAKKLFQTAMETVLEGSAAKKAIITAYKLFSKTSSEIVAPDNESICSDDSNADNDTETNIRESMDISIPVGKKSGKIAKKLDFKEIKPTKATVGSSKPTTKTAACTEKSKKSAPSAINKTSVKAKNVSISSTKTGTTSHTQVMNPKTERVQHTTGVFKDVRVAKLRSQYEPNTNTQKNITQKKPLRSSTSTRHSVSIVTTAKEKLNSMALSTSSTLSTSHKPIGGIPLPGMTSLSLSSSSRTVQNPSSSLSLSLSSTYNQSDESVGVDLDTLLGITSPEEREEEEERERERESYDDGRKTKRMSTKSPMKKGSSNNKRERERKKGTVKFIEHEEKENEEEERERENEGRRFRSSRRRSLTPMVKRQRVIEENEEGEREREMSPNTVTNTLLNKQQTDKLKKQKMTKKEEKKDPNKHIVGTVGRQRGKSIQFDQMVTRVSFNNNNNNNNNNVVYEEREREESLEEVEREKEKKRNKKRKCTPYKSKHSKSLEEGEEEEEEEDSVDVYGMYFTCLGENSPASDYHTVPPSPSLNHRAGEKRVRRSRRLSEAYGTPTHL
eukprot:CAMPEP_0182422586 /NCGR_PEP_ID=MMETSP1167-20130531/8288_1 /TAXON_ID=2988 /ORGANISM="Mallomonas Sp, Strain CCMP3275" /LENGTH=737 /DNA_ID=CAMNT_0024600755 /DNA_START=117 /DNA_END=2330 /DNA_ORIENTATION=-